MPTYEYACKSCGQHMDVVQSFTDDAMTTCPACGGQLRKVFGNIAIAFKGSGFYKTDNRSVARSATPAPGSSSESDSSAGSGSAQESGGDAKSGGESSKSPDPGSGSGTSDSGSGSGSGSGSSGSHKGKDRVPPKSSSGDTNSSKTDQSRAAAS